jgi:hypothetical protein
MPDISIQFYATPMELLTFLREAISDFKLHAVALRFRPFEAREVADADLHTYFTDSSEYRRWALTIGFPHLPVEHELDHADKNPDHLRLDVGAYDGNTLNESWLSCRTADKIAFAVWKKVAKRLKEMTIAGITATNRESGISAEYKYQRYSIGAKLLADRGVTIVSRVGPKGPEIKLGLLSKPTE